MKKPDKITTLRLAAAIVLYTGAVFATFDLRWLAAVSIIVAGYLIIWSSES